MPLLETIEPDDPTEKLAPPGYINNSASAATRTPIVLTPTDQTATGVPGNMQAQTDLESG